LIDGVHLPDLVGLAGPLRVGVGPWSGWGSRELQLAEPAAEGAFAGQCHAGVGIAEANPDVASPPAGMLLAQGQGFEAERVVGPAWPPRTGAVGRSQLAGVLAETAQQVLDGA
jgi:hypothetical protein